MFTCNMIHIESVERIRWKTRVDIERLNTMVSKGLVTITYPLVCTQHMFSMCACCLSCLCHLQHYICSGLFDLNNLI